MDKNVAYSVEYYESRKKYHYIYYDKYKTGEDKRLLSDNKHCIKITYYADDSHQYLDFNVHTCKIEIFDQLYNLVADYKSIYDKNLFELVEHSNGIKYFIFSIDLYGYSILNLSNYQCFHYIPETSFLGKAETFIWTDIMYCKTNNLLAVSGCFWAAPGNTEIYDLEFPENLPYKRLFSSHELVNVVSIYDDIDPVKWNNDGSITLSCFDNDNNKILKTIFINKGEKN